VNVSSVTAINSSAASLTRNTRASAWLPEQQRGYRLETSFTADGAAEDEPEDGDTETDAEDLPSGMSGTYSAALVERAVLRHHGRCNDSDVALSGTGLLRSSRRPG
jgi:hypothetical protein